MADLILTAASIKPGANAKKDVGTAGETLTAGQVVYKDPATQKYLKADSDSATAAVRAAKGIALTGSSLDQPVVVQLSGDITLGAVLTAGQTLFLSNTAGGICPDADVGAGEYVVLLGIAKSNSVLALSIQAPNVSR